ncbi:Fibrillin-1 [Stylophora pistillata]|uniref:Fibrillin-1 n=1 Tax=Stylophora pistillata TaxID=50429 RepID=A0A2B4RCF9_STYPI|nr:Fibrillin-1 [Stylophora pistillata]
MGAQEFFYLPAFVFLLLLFHPVNTQYHRDTREVSFFGMMLQNNIFKTITGAALGDVCLLECYRDVRCQSFNYVFTQDKCELSDRTKEARPEDFVPNSERYYFRRDMKRAHLGSILELPADSCKEIKSSEGGQAVSGKYWLNFIKPDTPVLAHCDMKTEDADECNASISVCDVNANCKNTLGSYRCFCRAGFSGDGHTCKDVDECNGSNPVCDVNADCKNTIGSYSCFCKAGFFGDGKNCNNAFRAIFTSLGASGRNGPTTLGSHYTGQDHDGQVVLSSGIQQWTVPYSCDYRIEAIGAAGGYGLRSNNGQYRGRGARMIGTFSLNKSETIQIIVGQEGGINNVSNSAGGGGGTFVVKGNNSPLIIAGGGGGMEVVTTRHAGCDASTSTAGNPGYRSWTGGSNGHGAQVADNGGGGGGFYSSGRSSRQFGGSKGNGGEGGKGFLQGGVGGRSWYNNIDGGFGGGAGSYGIGGGAGGGGGYSGGSSGDNEHDSCGGGGGSFNAGDDQQKECCYQTSGHGQVTITLLKI